MRGTSRIVLDPVGVSTSIEPLHYGVRLNHFFLFRAQLHRPSLWAHSFDLPVAMAANGETTEDAVNVPAKTFDTVLVLDFG